MYGTRRDIISEVVVVYFLARCMNWLYMNESTGKSITQYIKTIYLNVAIMTEKGWQATQHIWSNGQGPMNFDTLP